MPTITDEVQLPRHYRGDFFDQRAAELPWHLTDLDYPGYWKHTNAGEGVVWGVLDTGIDIKHPEVEDRIRNAQSFISNRRGVRDPDDFEDRNGHGTHVATTMIGCGVGYAPRGRLDIAKVLGDYGGGKDADVADGFLWLAEQGVSGINASLGSRWDSPIIRDAVKECKRRGIPVIAATGNEGGKVGYPAVHSCGVAAVDRSFKVADFSNRGEFVDVAFYGVDINAGVPGGYQYMSGTSMASPGISGVGMNLHSQELMNCGEILTRSDAALLAKSTFTIDLGTNGRDNLSGFGFPDFSKLFIDCQDKEPEAEELEIKFELDGKTYQGKVRRL